MVTTLGSVILEALERLQQNQYWLAEQVGVSAQAVTKWIQTGEISRTNATKVAKILDVSLDALLGGSQSEREEIGKAIDDLPDEQQQQVLDFIRYKIERSEGFMASEKAAHYMKMIDRIKADMAGRKGKDAAPTHPTRPPRRRT